MTIRAFIVPVFPINRKLIFYGCVAKTIFGFGYGFGSGLGYGIGYGVCFRLFWVVFGYLIGSMA